MTPKFLHAANPGPMTGDGNWTYLIGDQHPVLIDAGVGKQSHLDAIAAAAPSGPSLVLVTHAHSDHISGAPAIKQRWPDAQFKKFPWTIRDPEVGWSWLEDGSIVDTDDGPLTVLHTPGHAPDHLTLWHADSRTLFVGDMLVQGSTVVIPASQGGSLTSYLQSLERMLRLNPAIALPAHGPVIEDPAVLIHKYVEHRAQREEQVFGAIAADGSTVDSITAKIYPTLIEALVPMARESVLAHLQKLESERRVRRDGDRWVYL
ncbi:MAG TPA: MBL fold metallo-hydrolase [Vicinamibacterales bacterium]|nr:MBL fold metallo-hydrolase [Vicinamibacterales bacterium]